MHIEILTVSYFSKDLLKFNWECFQKKNAGSFTYNWHISDNSLWEDEEIEGFKYHEGIKHKVDPIFIDKLKLGSGSVHHGMGLNKGIQYLDKSADLWLILDPDFYFLTPIFPLLEYIKENQLWFFGAEYVNVRKKLVRDFPCAFCMFINPSLVPIEKLDFSAGYETEEQRLEGWYPDTGFKIMHRFKNDPLCKFATFPNNDSNVYRVCNTNVAVHLRAKIDKLSQYNHNRPIDSGMNLKVKLKEVRNLIKESKRSKIRTEGLKGKK